MPSELESLRPGAGVAVRTCLAIGPDDRVFVLTDDVTLAIGEALALEALATGAAVTLHRLEEFAPRPVVSVPPALVDAYRAFQPTASFFAASSQRGEITFRLPFGKILRSEFRVRHGHMPGITPQLIREGMATDYNRVYDVTMRVHEVVSRSRTMHITSPKGTDVHAEFDPALRWVACHGRYHKQGDWGNLPEGETYTSPGRLDGIIVADILGDYFSSAYGLLAEPVTFTIRDNFVTSVESANKALAAEVSEYLDSADNGRRAGEFAVGTNVGLTRLVGNLLQDEKYPGIHVAFGNPYPEQTGAPWACRLHVDVIPVECTIDVDGRRLMTGGVFSPDVL